MEILAAGSGTTVPLSLCLLDKLMNPVFRIHFDQQMHMIRHDFHLNNLNGALFSHLMNDPLQSFIHALCQDPTPVLRTPDHMLFAGEYHVVGGFVDHTLMIWRNAV